MQQANMTGTLKGRLVSMMLLRVVLAIAFLGITTWFQLRDLSDISFTRPIFYPLYAIVATVGFLTIVYAFVLDRIKSLKLFTYSQFSVDMALITGIVYVTGGVESFLSVMYLLTVIGSAILLGKRGGYYAASISSIMYGVVVDLDYYGWLPSKLQLFQSQSHHAWQDVLTTLSTNILAFFTIAYLVGHLADKTARAEKELEEKEIDFGRLERLNRHIVENITSGIMTLDPSLKITSFNRAAEEMTGYTLKELYYRDSSTIFPGVVNAALEPGETERVEKVFGTKDGTELSLGFSVSRGTGDELSYIVIFQDLTRLKAMEEELRRSEKLKALGELSVGIAHEIRNPLASISGSIQVLKDEVELQGEERHLMDIVLRETARLDALITDYLLFARPAQEKREVMNLAHVISDAMTMFRNSKEASGLKIDLSLSDEVYIYGDRRQIGQVFWNLFLNAAHSMAGMGTLTVELKTARSGPGEGVAEVSVCDTGKGIPKEALERIFDPFFSTKASGTGLGLAIVHRIIESHGGSIEAKNSPSGGALFRLTMPLRGDASKANVKEYNG